MQKFTQNIMMRILTYFLLGLNKMIKENIIFILIIWKSIQVRWNIHMDYMNYQLILGNILHLQFKVNIQLMSLGIC